MYIVLLLPQWLSLFVPLYLLVCSVWERRRYYLMLRHPESCNPQDLPFLFGTCLGPVRLHQGLYVYLRQCEA